MWFLQAGLLMNKHQGWCRSPTDGQPGHNTQVDRLLVDAPQFLPHVEQRRIVVDEGADLVHDHEKDGDVHGPGVG